MKHCWDFLFLIVGWGTLCICGFWRCKLCSVRYRGMLWVILFYFTKIHALNNEDDMLDLLKSFSFGHHFLLVLTNTKCRGIEIVHSSIALFTSDCMSRWNEVSLVGNWGNKDCGLGTCLTIVGDVKWQENVIKLYSMLILSFYAPQKVDGVMYLLFELLQFWIDGMPFRLSMHQLS